MSENQGRIRMGHQVDRLSPEAFARKAHMGHMRNGPAGLPYASHLEEVAAFVARHGGDAHTVAAAWLHDCVEDVGTTFDEIMLRFGPEVVAIVAEVTDDKRAEKIARKARQTERAPLISPRAALLKVADKASNVGSILNPDTTPDWGDARKRAYVSWACGVVERLRGVPESAREEFETIVGTRAAVRATRLQSGASGTVQTPGRAQP